jgi:hypothetical protein
MIFLTVNTSQIFFEPELQPSRLRLTEANYNLD